MSKAIYLERNIFGRLYNPRMDQFSGGIGDIAYSKGFSPDHQKRIENKITLGFGNTNIKDTDIFGFYSIGESDFTAVHSKLMAKSEDTKRGRSIYFSEFILISSEQLESIYWNLIDVFSVFSTEPKRFLFEHPKSDLEQYSINLDANQDKSWFMDLRSNTVRVAAVLSAHLSPAEKLTIIAGPDDPRIRLRFLCSLVKTLPTKFREVFSFSTFPGLGNNSARILFSSSQESYHTRETIDWEAPKLIPGFSGGIYAKWISDTLEELEGPKDFEKAISDLHSSTDNKSYRNIGDELDAAVKFLSSPLEHRTSMNSKVELEHYTEALKLYRPLLTNDEVAEKLSYLLNNVMKQSAYNVGVTALSNHMSIIHEVGFRERLVRRIGVEVFSTPVKAENLDSLSIFIKQITEHAMKTDQDELIDLCQEILILALELRDYRIGLRLWSKVSGLRWANSARWFVTALETLSNLRSKEEFIFIVNDIGCPTDRKCFESLFRLLKRSSNISNQFPENTRFLEMDERDGSQEYLDCIAKCLSEVKSNKWLSTQIGFGCQNYPELPAKLPQLMVGIGIAAADNLLNHVVAAKYDLLTVLVSYSIMLLRTRQSGSDSFDINNYMGLSKDCRPENVNTGLVILESHWGYFSVEALEFMLNILESKSTKHQNIESNIIEIRHAIQRKNLTRKIQTLFSNKVKKSNLGYIIRDFVIEFCQSSDINAWKLFETQIRSYDLTVEYRGYLIYVLLENRFFRITDSQLQRISRMLDEANLNYEADIFIYWTLSEIAL